MATSGAGFSFKLPAQIKNAIGGSRVTVSKANSDPLPSWILFNAETMSLGAGAVPDGALPIQVVLTTGGKQVRISISERKEQ